MENERAARFFIGTLLNRESASVKMLPQEFTRYDEAEKLTVFRLDFMATIRTDSGEHQKILIEVQKAKEETDLMRFRGYLGEQYKKEDEIDGVKMALPITTIYILGFTLPEVPTACMKVGREYKDLVDNMPLDTRSPFVEKLTHDSYVVQVSRITGRYQTRLDKLLSIFEQAYFTDTTDAVKRYNHEPDDADVKVITELLHHVGTDPDERKELDGEIEFRRTLNEWFGKHFATIAQQRRQLEEAATTFMENKKKLEEAATTLSENKKKLEETTTTLSENKKKLEEAATTLSEQTKALSEKDERIAELERLLKDTGKM
jgi:DNA repair exonuclease SbcCD ATPase subunit